MCTHAFLHDKVQLDGFKYVLIVLSIVNGLQMALEFSLFMWTQI